jgi:hypothetical protein
MSKAYRIPDAILNGHIACLGMTGAGKTTTTKLIVETIVKRDPNARVHVLDPIKMDWWGITASADGKSPGLPFSILGGPHGHVPLHDTSGRAIAELVADGRLKLSISDMKRFKPGGHQRYFIDFAETLLERIQGVVYLVLEEAHIFAPKERSGIGNENMAVHWAKMLAMSGRSAGIRLIVNTQSIQSLHNRVLGSMETLIAMRLIAPADQKPVLNWLQANIADPVLVKKIGGSLATNPTGSGWLCSGQARIFEFVEFRRITTFDNSATPTSRGKRRTVTTAPVDEEKLREIIGQAVKVAEAEDPKALKKRLETLEREKADFERQLQAVAARKTPADPKDTEAADQRGYARAQKEAEAERRKDLATINSLRQALEVAMKFIIEIEAKDFFKAGGETVDQASIEKVIADATKQATKLIEQSLAARGKELDKLQLEAQRLAARLKGLLDQADQDVTVKVGVTHNQPFTVKATSAAPATRPAAQSSDGAHAQLTPAKQRILDAIAWFETIGENAPDKAMVAFAADASSTSSTYQNNTGALRTAGLLDYPGSGTVALTEAGRALAQPRDAPLDHQTMMALLAAKLPPAQIRLLAAAAAKYPHPLTKDELAAMAGASPTSSTYQNNLGRLRTLGLLDYPASGQVCATKRLFP